MSLISVTNVEVLNNPARFTDKFQFEISFECIAPVKAGTTPTTGRRSAAGLAPTRTRALHRQAIVG